MTLPLIGSPDWQGALDAAHKGACGHHRLTSAWALLSSPVRTDMNIHTHADAHGVTEYDVHVLPAVLGIRALVQWIFALPTTAKKLSSHP